MTELEDFCVDRIEGWLFPDLQAMADADPARDPRHGGCNGPMNMTLFGAIELFGFLTWPGLPTGRGASAPCESCFLHYWKHVLHELNPLYSQANGEVSYRLGRHWMAHKSIMGRGLNFAKNLQHLHLETDGRILRIDATALFDDVKNSYKRFIRPAVFDGTPCLISNYEFDLQIIEARFAKYQKDMRSNANDVLKRSKLAAPPP